MRRHAFAGAALVALTMWAGALRSAKAEGAPFTGILVVDGVTQTNKANLRATWKFNGKEETQWFSTDSTGAFSVPTPDLSGSQPGRVAVVMDDARGGFSVTADLAVVAAPYALVAAEAKTLVCDGDLVLSDATLTCLDLEVTGTVMVTNSLSARRLWARDFPSNEVNVVEVRDLTLAGSYPNRGRLRWFGKEVVVMEGKADEYFSGAGVNEAGWTFNWDGVSSGRFHAAVGRGSWLEPNIWTAPTDGFCRWVSASKVTGLTDGSAANLAGISIKHEDGGSLDVLPVGVVEGLHDPIAMTFPVRKGDVVTIRYSVAVPSTKSNVHCSAEMSLLFRPIGLDK